MYVVIENTPGYMPDDDDPATFETLGEARAHARGLVARLREFHWEVGDTAKVRVDSHSAPRSWYVVTGREHDLGRVIEIVEAV